MTEVLVERTQEPSEDFSLISSPTIRQAFSLAPVSAWQSERRRGKGQTRGMAQRSEDGVGKTSEESERLERALAVWTRSAISIQASGV